MKVLVAADGATLNSRVAKRFGHATCFLVADARYQEILSVHSGRDQRAALVAAAASDGIGIVIAGGIGPHGFDLLTANGMAMAVARSMTVRNALEKFSRGHLRTLGGPTVHRAMEEHTLHKLEHRHQSHRREWVHTQEMNAAAGTQRGRYHLQQLAGRGH